MALPYRPFLDPRLTTGAHTLQLVLAIIIVVITIVRITKPIPFTRGQILALTMGLKSIISIQYQFITTHVPACRRWKRVATFAILNVLEVVTWPISLAFQFLGVAQVCIGESCDLQKASAALSVIVLIVAIQPAVSSTVDYLHQRKYNAVRGQEPLVMR